MNKIFVSYYPFTYYQPIACLDEEGNTIDSTMVKLDDVPLAIQIFCKKHNTKDVVLVGNQNFLEHFKSELNTKFSNDNLNVEIMVPDYF